MMLIQLNWRLVRYLAYKCFRGSNRYHKTELSEEMASDEVKKERESFVKAGIDAAQLAKVEVTY